MIRFFTVILFLLFSVFAFSQQTPQYGQYMFDQFAVNPAYAGSKRVTSFLMHYRDQWWNSVEGAPKTFLTSFHTPLKRNKIAIGFQLANDRIGPKSSTGALGTYVYRIRFGKKSLAAGLRVGIFQYVFNVDQIKYFQTEPVWGGNAVYKKTVPTCDFGVYYNTQSWYVGASILQLAGGNLLQYSYSSALAGNVLSKSHADPHAYIIAGKSFQINENLIFNPSVLLKGAKNVPGSLDINLNFMLEEKIWLGLSMRSGYGYGFLVQVLATDKIKIGYMFDRKISAFGGFPGKMSNELLLQFDFSKKRSRMVSPKYLYL